MRIGGLGVAPPARASSEVEVQPLASSWQADASIRLNGEYSGFRLDGTTPKMYFWLGSI